MKRRRGIDIFNLSFLDVVSCGFGAIILLLVIVKISEPRVIEQLAVDLRGRVAELDAAKQELAVRHAVVTRQLQAAESDLVASDAAIEERSDTLVGLRAAVEHERPDNAQLVTLEGRLQQATQRLSEEMRRLQGDSWRRAASDSPIGGIPVDSEYIIFIIDTSGSMQQNAWPQVVGKVEEVLEVYPQVKGIQVMNDMGEYMFSSYAGQWIQDSPARRRAIMARLSGWAPFSNSSPVEGIEAAIRRFYARDKRISLYVFGDDFSRGSIQQVLDTVATLNRADASGQRRVRIHAIGFPVLFSHGGLNQNVVRFAALMRRLAETNQGSFVGLERLTP